MKTEKRNYPNIRLHNMWYNPGRSTKVNISMKAGEGIYSCESMQIDWDTPKDTIKVKDNMRFGKKIEPTEHCMSERNAPEKKRLFPRKAK